MTKPHKTISALLQRKEGSTADLADALLDVQTIKDNFVELTVDGRPLISGELVFKLIDTHGMPFEIVIDSVYHKGASVKWEEFIITALGHKWRVYQIMEKLEYGLKESFFFSKNEAAIEGLLFSARVCICQNVPAFNKYLIKSQ